MPHLQKLQQQKDDTTEALAYAGRASNPHLGHFHFRGKSKHQQYYTPLAIAELVHDALTASLPEGLSYLSVLDPTCGSGRLLLPWKRKGASVLGVELDREGAAVARRLLGKEAVREGDLLDYAPHLQGYSVVVMNPPYGILWHATDKSFPFEAVGYGDAIESQAATLEICTAALTDEGLLVAILPGNTFTQAQDAKLRHHLYGHYTVLLRATLQRAFKAEYKIDADTVLVLAQKSRHPETNEPVQVTVDAHRPGWEAPLKHAIAKALSGHDIQLLPSEAEPVPHLTSLRPLASSLDVRLTPKGVQADLPAVGFLQFVDAVLEEYNPLHGVPTGFAEARLSPAALIRRGVEDGEDGLRLLGFAPAITEKDRERLQRVKARYDFLCVPLSPPRPHQLLAYLPAKPVKAQATVTDDKGSVLFEEGKEYLVRPSWIRNREVVSVQQAYDERKKGMVTISTSLDHGYLALDVQTEQGPTRFEERNVEDVKQFTEAFPLPVVKDLAQVVSPRVEALKTHIARRFPFLFPYQIEDLSRLALKPQGYLGYEMGGGKTVTAAAWATLRRYRKVLVVCPSGLVDNWLHELTKFGFRAERLTTHRSLDKLLQGKRNKGEERETRFYLTSYEFLSLATGKKYEPWDCVEYDEDGNVRRQSLGNTTERCPQCGKHHDTVVKTCPRCNQSEEWTGKYCHACHYSAYTYTRDRRTYPAYKRLQKLFGAVLVDEAQMAKSKNTSRGRAVRALKPKGRLILTGTLMKGYVHDVYWNLGWLLGHGSPLFPYPYRGGSGRFLAEFGTYEYVTKQFEDTLHEGRGKLIPEVSNLNRFWRLLAPFAVRRTKDTMVELPEKKREVLLLEMDPAHASLYAEYHEWASTIIKDALGKAERTGTEVNMGVISKALWALRFAATVPTATDYLCRNGGPNKALDASSWNKLRKVLDLLTEIRGRGEKAIVFSGLRPMVARISRALEGQGIRYLPVLASHPTHQRLERIQAFSEDPKLTALVAGLNVMNRGFTVTAATHVILTDVEFSPEATAQAEDRAHRTGQTAPVTVYYLFSAGTVDEVMFELISQKQAAITHAIDGHEVHRDVAQLLNQITGGIQLEVAKRVAATDVPKMPLLSKPAVDAGVASNGARREERLAVPPVLPPPRPPSQPAVQLDLFAAFLRGEEG